MVEVTVLTEVEIEKQVSLREVLASNGLVDSLKTVTENSSNLVTLLGINTSTPRYFEETERIEGQRLSEVNFLELNLNQRLRIVNGILHGSESNCSWRCKSDQYSLGIR